MDLTIPESLRGLVTETRKKYRLEHERWAADAFGRHVLSEVSDNVWLCERPKDSAYHFYVAMPQHAIIVYGDIGEMILRPGWNRSIGWLRGALREGEGEYFDYLLEKVPSPHRREVFMPGDAIEHMVDEARDDPDSYGSNQRVLDEFAEAVDTHGDIRTVRESWVDAIYECGYDGEYCIMFDEPDAEMYWCAHALRWFMKEWVKQYGDTEGH